MPVALERFFVDRFLTIKLGACHITLLMRRSVGCADRHRFAFSVVLSMYRRPFLVTCRWSTTTRNGRMTRKRVQVQSTDGLMTVQVNRHARIVMCVTMSAYTTYPTMADRKPLET